jgi:flagellin
MALGVLNNLSAIYAENNLNNTNNSLQTVLQQLSSGSKINSGADDAAGLSLVNGLQANQTALTQSETNATEGVGLLQVADGALSQVTSLLNRAITLATEASNGTLDSTQESAANQEYQSILAEVNNVGSTTTYNQEQVFTGNAVAIYTGDSSKAGSSIVDLNIRALSSSSVGDTGGAMVYSNGSNNVFINLSTATTGAGLATANDALKNPTSTIDVSYLAAGAGGTTVVQNTAIGVGAGEASTDDTAQGLINAINSAGLGLVATFTTGTAAGDTAAGVETGIEITSTGAGVGNGAAPGLVGTLTATAVNDDLSGTLTIKGADGATTTINLATGNAGSAYTVAQLQIAINNGGYGITASGTTTLTFTAADSSVSVSGANVTTTTGADTASFTASPEYYSVGITDSAAAAAPDIADGATGQTALLPATFTGDTGGTGGIATISYTDGAGESLNGTDLLSQTNAQLALNDLNLAVTDVAALDGYVGAQINTLNAVSQVMSTQQENVVSAQNAIQATDYASATSSMSKFEILSQTGIAALAQANSVQQEVTKLLQ